MALVVVPLGLLALGVVYWLPIRRWFMAWGASTADLTRTMTGDAVLVDPSYSTTLAITIDARPEHVWPWLLQMGYRRGGVVQL